ncbi:zinc-ribbon, c4HC2 type domain-containing protein [Ditylenchus destructor]|uniref:Zinc-ribbon, c4HC2 type domain-containing protein n=1 Tax=Ditylenchus destructor TaxID=166010 RepID=A0AAD4NIR3_9BILA|nr:zinc-ribbon, c4HC2 type domain-containing protein [Ditylenchus destructor]
MFSHRMGAPESISINSDLSRIRDEAFDLKSFQKSEKELQRIESIVEDEIDEGDILFNDGQQMLSRSSDSSQGIGSGDEIEISTGCHISMWDPLPRIKAILEFYSQMGDVQTTSSICLVLGEKVVDMKLIKSTQVDLWFYAYLEMLERLELWNAAAAFIKMSYRPKINQISNESTFVKMACVKCRAILTKSSTHCKACNTDSMSVTRCSICEQLVRGVWSSCDYCGHGGHTDHMREWFAKFNYCPFIGCGHFCQKTVRR